MEFARNHSGSIETQRNSCSGSVETKDPSHRARRCGRQPKWPPRKRPEEATRGRNSREATAGASKCNGIRAKPQREHRNATEFARNHSGSVETKDVAVGNLSGPPKKRPEEATRDRNSCETTPGPSKCNGIRAKPQRQHRNATEFARNHSGSVERPRPTARAIAVGNLSGPPRRGLKATRGRNSRESTGGASRHNGIRAKPQRERRNQGPVPPPRAPLRSATNSFTLNVRTPLCKHCLGNKEQYIKHNEALGIIGPSSTQ